MPGLVPARARGELALFRGGNGRGSTRSASCREPIAVVGAMTDRLLTTRQVADLLGLSPETVLRRSGEIPGYRLASTVCGSASQRSRRGSRRGVRRDVAIVAELGTVEAAAAVTFAAATGLRPA